ncbi:hypothetical protein FNV43_RR19051 [Rhamnella rubrinervis]|uniref:Uncharacterized protein n=1 Tax=Rhamnella rubrinervis TaxID=2594499 RepID=A0A8K0E0G3_9ROSA|nr:hypothetical protein FNV43_RR19051 [Rhamnella rubrinervis]
MTMCKSMPMYCPNIAYPGSLVKLMVACLVAFLLYFLSPYVSSNILIFPAITSTDANKAFYGGVTSRRKLASVPSRLANLEAYIQSLELDKLMFRVEALESLTNRVRALEKKEPSLVSTENRPQTSSIDPGEEHASATDNAVAELTRVVNELLEDVAVIVDTLKREIANLSTKVNVTMVAIGNPSPPSTGMDYERIKMP